MNVVEIAPVDPDVVQELRTADELDRKTLCAQLRQDLGLSFDDSIALVERVMDNDPPSDWSEAAQLLGRQDDTLVAELRAEPDRYQAVKLARVRVTGLGIVEAERLVDALRA